MARQAEPGRSAASHEEQSQQAVVDAIPGSLQSRANQVTPAVCNWIGDWFVCMGTAYVTTVVNLNR
jgi:hypothetical protein